MDETMNVEERLIESFEQLVMQKPVEKITIKEIADGAGVIRTTFYYHFQDKYELVERIIERDLVEPMMKPMREKERDAVFLQIFQLLDARRRFYRRLARMEGQNSFEQLLRQYISEALEKTIRLYGSEEKLAKMNERYPWLSVSFVTEYYAREVTYALITFLRTDPPASPEDAAQIIGYVLSHSPDETIMNWFMP